MLCVVNKLFIYRSQTVDKQRLIPYTEIPMMLMLNGQCVMGGFR